MMEEAVLPIREFSRLTGISREALRFYDNIGLLSPEARGENGYRYYAARQLDFAFLVSELRALGMGLEEIKNYADRRTPKGMLLLFREQSAHIEAEINRLRSIQTAMSMRTKAAEDALRREEGVVLLEEREREPIFLCPPAKSGNTETESSLQAFNYAIDHEINISYPFGVVLKKEHLQDGNRPTPFQLYFRAGEGYNAWKSAGTYAVYLCRSTDQQAGLYLPIISFLKERGLRMVGDAYEECPLDEISTHRREEYRIQVEVRVEV